MIGAPGMSVVMIDWIANPFRGDRFEEAWRPAAEAALDYGAGGYAFFRNKDDGQLFTQLAFFESKVDFERYWLSPEIADARTRCGGLFQVPVLPVWLEVVTAGTPAEQPTSA